MNKTRKAARAIIDFVSNKSSLLIGIPLLLFLLFRPAIEVFISTLLVGPILAKLVRGPETDTAFVAFILLEVAYFLGKPKGYIISRTGSIGLLCFAAAYLYYRYFSHIWIFTPLYTVSAIKYADVLLLPASLTLVLLAMSFVSRKQKVVVPSATILLFDDAPLGTNKPDELGYERYAGEIAGKIIANKFDKSFAIGVNGKWGSGKTSFLDLVKRDLSSDDNIVIDFHPWNSSTPKSVIQDFFDTAQKAVSPYHSSLSRLLSSYAQKLVSLNDNAVTKTLSNALNLLAGKESVNSLFDEINESIKSIDKRIICFIDDLDRLDEAEIIEVIRLIRNTANFYNTVFLVAYDRTYVINAIKSYNSYEPNLFLEKIFQVEINLPTAPIDVLVQRFYSNVVSFTPEPFRESIHSAIYGNSMQRIASTRLWLQTMRDVTRLSNALQINATHLFGEVYMPDLLNVEMLRMKFPAVYELIAKQKRKFLKTHNSNSEQHIYKLEDNGNKTNAGYSTVIESYLNENKEKLLLDTESVQGVLSLLKALFGTDGPFYGDTPHNLSIVRPSKFQRYFTYFLSNESLSELEFSKARLLPQAEFNAQVDVWCKAGLDNELRAKFTEIDEFDSREDFEKVIRAIIFFANQPIASVYFSGNAGFNSNEFFGKIIDYDGRISRKYYTPTSSEKEAKYQDFITSLFADAKSPYGYESALLRALQDEIDSHFPLNLNDRNTIALRYFSSYLDSVNALDSNVWHLYHATKQVEWVSEGHGSYTKQKHNLDAAEELMRLFLFGRGLDSFITISVQRERFSLPEKETYALASNTIMSFCDSWDHFEAIIYEADIQSHVLLEEFIGFYKKAKAVGYDQFFPYKLEFIKV